MLPCEQPRIKQIKQGEGEVERDRASQNGLSQIRLHQNGQTKRSEGEGVREEKRKTRERAKGNGEGEK